MKLRIKGNSIRLRLAQVEVMNCAAKGHVSDGIYLSSSSKLEYALEYAQGDNFALAITDSRLVVQVPKQTLDQWAGSDKEVGIYNTISDPTGNQVKLVIEKDFQCLTERPGEDESGLYPNPNNPHDGKG